MTEADWNKKRDETKRIVDEWIDKIFEEGHGDLEVKISKSSFKAEVTPMPIYRM